MSTERFPDAQPDGHFSALVDLSGGATDRPRLIVSGEVDAVNADQLQEAVGDLLRDHRPHHIEIDFAGVPFLDSAGIRALVLCHANAERADCLLTVASPRRNVYRILEVTRLLDHFGMIAPLSWDRPGPATAFPSG